MPAPRSSLRTASALQAHAAAWRALGAHATLPTQAWAWVQASAAHLAPEGTLRIHVRGEEAAVALVRRGGPGTRRLELLSVAELSEPADLLCAHAAAREALCRELALSGTPLRLARVPAGSPTVAALHTVYGRRLLVRPQEGSPAIDLDASWREPESKLNARRRSDLRRARRRAEQLGPLDLAVHAPGPDDVDALIQEAWAVEARSWRAKRHGALAQDPLRGPFFEAFARLAAADGTLRIALLRAGDQTLAMQLNVVFANALWLLKVGFDEEHGKCSPGMLLTAETIRYAASEGLAAYEFLGVVESWTSIWTDVVRPYVTLRAYPLSVSGATGFVGDVAGKLRAKLGRSTS
jgi:CelD/BcsL family acetyltransferase involved in cellulose biosynthesis